MTDDELFVSTLKKIRDEMVEERSLITEKDELNSQIAAEYDEGLEILNRVIPQINQVDDVWSLEEEDFIYVISCFENYSEVFIIDGRDEKKLKADEKEFAQLQEILFQFYDDDDEDYEECCDGDEDD